MRQPMGDLPRKKVWLTSLGLALIGGLAAYLAFPPHDHWVLAPVACAVLWLALARLNAWRGWLCAWLFAMVWFLPLFWWAHQAAGTVPWLALSVASAALFGLMAPVWCGLRRALAKRPVWAAVCFATLVAGVDTLRSHVPFGGFPWGRLAFSQAGSPLGRWAWLAGAPWVSWCVALVGALLASGFTLYRPHGWRWSGALLVAAVGVTTLPLVWPLGEGLPVGVVSVGAVQGNVTVSDQGLFAHQREVLNNHVTGTLELAALGADLDLVIWPENATDIDPQKDEAAAQAIEQAASAVGAPILLGAMEYTGHAHRYNLAMLWTPGQGVTAKYAKRHPAPFGEYMPGRGFFRLFTSKVDLVGTDMLAGQHVGLINVPVVSLDRDVPLGVVICFEVAYDSLTAETVKAGAELLVVQTNNASFGHTSESLQQLAMSRLRAIELGRSTIQVSTVGVSAVIESNGRVTHQTGLFEPAVFTAELNLHQSRTPALYLGHPFSLVCLLAAAVLAAKAILDGWRRWSTTPRHRRRVKSSKVR